MMNMKRTMHKNPIEVSGNILNIGDVASDFTCVNTSLTEVSLSEFDDQYVIINVVPSLDTGVCDLQTKEINTKLASLPNSVVLTISNDLPFAQKRWCGAVGLDNIITLSDYQTLDFANKYGVNILGLRLLARAVFVLNQKREVVYLEYLEEMTNHPNYDKLFNFIETL